MEASTLPHPVADGETPAVFIRFGSVCSIFYAHLCSVLHWLIHPYITDTQWNLESLILCVFSAPPRSMTLRHLPRRWRRRSRRRRRGRTRRCASPAPLRLLNFLFLNFLGRDVAGSVREALALPRCLAKREIIKNKKHVLRASFNANLARMTSQ